MGFEPISATLSTKDASAISDAAAKMLSRRRATSIRIKGQNK